MRFRTGAILIGALAALISLYSVLEARLSDFYIFDSPSLHALAREAITNHGNDTAAMVRYIVDDLSQKHPKNINLEEEWVFNNAGGAMGAMYILHASVTEYVIIFGTAVGTEGHSGRHPVDNFFHILTGTQTAYTPGPGSFLPEVYPPGSMHYMPRGTVQQYKMDSTCFALEYSRGWIPPMLFFGLADMVTSTLDFQNIWRTGLITAREMGRNLGAGKF
ncbi:C-8 sterol isomerase [Lophium mytilinum]|uniref:C-8 sterol isomerase n=1 Tax=Lophium mytilinum TaxID=390894 RepID=A0A6A6QPD8_9PEZI|nr:C-8 sterol isomerase [Lophium mytilinum]